MLSPPAVVVGRVRDPLPLLGHPLQVAAGPVPAPATRETDSHTEIVRARASSGEPKNSTNFPLLIIAPPPPRSPLPRAALPILPRGALPTAAPGGVLHRDPAEFFGDHLRAVREGAVAVLPRGTVHVEPAVRVAAGGAAMVCEGTKRTNEEMRDARLGHYLCSARLPRGGMFDVRSPRPTEPQFCKFVGSFDEAIFI